MTSDTDAFDKVSGIVGDAMNDAWKKIIHNLADVANGKKPVSAFSAGGNSLSVDEVKEFFAIAGGANLAVNFPAVVPKTPVGLFYADVIDHGVASARQGNGAGPKNITGSISIGVGISF